MLTAVSPHRFSERLHGQNLRAFFESHEPRVVGMLEPVSLPTTHVQLRGGELLPNNFAQQSLSVGFERANRTPFIFVHLEREPESSELAVKLIEDHGLGVEFLYRNNDLSSFGLEVPKDGPTYWRKPATYDKVDEAYGGKGSGPKDGPTWLYGASILTLQLALLAEEDSRE